MTTFTRSNALFAPLFLDGEIEELFSTDTMVAEFTRFEVALTRALASTGQIDDAKARSAISAMESFRPNVAALEERICADGLPVPGYVAQLKAHTGDDLAEAIHVGTTSQDLIDTAFACIYRRANEIIVTRLEALTDMLDSLKHAHGTQGLMGRTRMQAALPITVGDRIRIWTEPLRGLHAAFIGSRVAQLQLGGPVGDRLAFGENADAVSAAVAAELGLANPRHSWHSDRQAVVSHGDLLSRTTGALGKIGHDITLMAQQGIDEVRIAGGGTSSAMPHKQNPIAAELLVTLARFNATQIGGLHQALVHEQERSGAMWALEWMILPEMAMTTGRALLVATDLIASIEKIGSD